MTTSDPRPANRRLMFAGRYWPAVRVALRRAWAVLSFLAALAVVGGTVWHYTHQPPPCVIVGYAPAANGHPAYTYSPAGCQPVSTR